MNLQEKASKYQHHSHMHVLNIMFTIGLLLPVLVFGESEADSLSHPKQIAFLNAIGQPTFIWAVNWYVLDQYWANISIQTLKNNIETGWVWDEDGFDVNQVGHPTQGAFVYTAARAQGLSYWQSIAYPTIASFIWEIGMETESPSINDMITTPMSGVSFGEIIHRLSALTLGPGTTKPLSRQLFAGLINPFGYGVNRILRGESIHQNFNYRPSNLLAEISMGGGPGYRDKSNLDNSMPSRFVRFNLVYGNPISKAKLFKPFDNFSFVSILNFSRKDYVGEIYASGMLARFYSRHSEKSKLVVSLFHNYDFMNQDNYKVSSSSVGPGIIHVYSVTPKLSFGTHVNGSFIFMGSAGDISDDTKLRDYHFGQGFSAKFMSKIIWAQRGEAYLRVKRYFIYAMEESHVEGFENINLLTAGGHVRVWEKYGIGVEGLVASRTVSYLNVERRETLQNTSMYRVYISYSLANKLFN
jgi:hypothetical protein